MSISPRPPDSPQQARRVLVTGSREWDGYKVIYDALDAIARTCSSLVVVHGDCPKGADYWAKRWVLENLSNRVHHEPHPARWAGPHGRRAGLVRNTEMAKLGADLCLAFIHNNSNGATHCAREAVGYGIPTVIFRQTYPDLSQIADALALAGSAGDGVA